MIRVNGQRRGIARSGPLKIKPRWSAQLVHLIAHLMFDGRIDRWGCYYYNRSASQLEHVQRLLQQLYGVSPRIKWRSSGVGSVICYHVELAARLQSQAQTLSTHIATAPQGWRRPFLKAFFDDEGHIYFNGSKRRVRGTQKDPKRLSVIKRLLAKETIGSRLDIKASAVEISGRENLERFQERIDFSSGIRVNPARSNARWHQPLEKREILRLALASYR